MPSAQAPLPISLIDGAPPEGLRENMREDKKTTIRIELPPTTMKAQVLDSAGEMIADGEGRITLPDQYIFYPHKHHPHDELSGRARTLRFVTPEGTRNHTLKGVEYCGAIPAGHYLLKFQIDRG